MKTILIYQDYTHNNGSLYKVLKDYFKVEYTDISDIENGILSTDISAFIMPGGASRYVADKMNGIGNQKLKEYISQGGLYIGICAGAYYGCRRTEWKNGQDDAICVDNEIIFFPGISKGPIQSLNQNITVDGKCAVKTNLLTSDGQTHAAFYWDGCWFEPDEGANDFEILARYQDAPDQPAAIVTGAYGQGRYLLIGPHLEIDTKQLELMTFDVMNNRHAEIAAMKDTAGLSTNLFHALLRKFTS